MADLTTLTINDDGFLDIPVGTTAQRPTSPTAGMMRINSDLLDDPVLEVYNGSVWKLVYARDGTTRERSARRSTDILLANPNAETGWYWVDMNGNPQHVFVDMDYDGGGWVLAGSHVFNISIPNLIQYGPATSDVRYSHDPDWIPGDSEPTNGTCWLALDGWEAVVSANDAGRNIVYYVAGSNVGLGATGSHSKRARWTFTGFGSNYSVDGAANFSRELGDNDPGFWNTHMGSPFTARDRDQDNNSGNCATYYNNAPWWYTSCWSGNFWGGNGNGYQNAAFWNGSGSDYFQYGAIYVK